MPNVIILLCTFNGAKYLEQQLVSIAKQTYVNWTLFVSDDNSTDDTVKIIKAFKNQWGDNKVKFFQGPQKGYAKNFHFLTRHALNSAEFFAFCDQDDIWHKDKLSKAIKYLSQQPSEIAALHATSSKLITANGKFISLSKIPKRKLSFYNALTENIAGGNTMTFNKPLARLFCLIPDDTKMISHDWLLYQFVTAVNGHISFETTPSIQYRQHDKNSVGTSTGIINKTSRLIRFLRGNFYHWMEINLQCLHYIKDQMPDEHINQINELQTIRSSGIVSRLLFFLRLKLYRQQAMQTLILRFGFLLGKV